MVPSHDQEVKRTSLNLIVDVAVEGAAKSDAAALKPVVDRLVENGLKPKELLADTLYGGQENCEYAAANGIDLIAPVPGREGAPKKDMGADKGDKTEGEISWSAALAHDAADRAEIMEDEAEPPAAALAGPFRLTDFGRENGEIKFCPMGVERLGIMESGDNKRVYFPRSACETCPFKGGCPMKAGKKQAWLCYGGKELERAERRACERTAEFRDKYRWRSGIKGQTAS